MTAALQSTVDKSKEKTESFPKACIITGSQRMISSISAFDYPNTVVKPNLADMILEYDSKIFIVDLKVGDMHKWESLVFHELKNDRSSQNREKLWFFLASNLGDTKKVDPMPYDSKIMPRRIESLKKLLHELKQRADPNSNKKIERVAFDNANRTFVIRMQNLKRYSLKVSDISEADDSPITKIVIGEDKDYFKVEQASGNWFEVPWDEILYHCEPEYEYYKGRNADNISATSIGNKIRKIREEKGLSITDLARKINIKRPNLSRIEHGKHCPSLETLERIAESLGITVANLLARNSA